MAQVNESGEPPTKHAYDSTVAEMPRETGAPPDTAITIASLPLPPSPSQHDEGEAYREEEKGSPVTLQDDSTAVRMPLGNRRVSTVFILSAPPSSDDYLQQLSALHSILEVSEPPSEYPSPLEPEDTNASALLLVTYFDFC